MNFQVLPVEIRHLILSHVFKGEIVTFSRPAPPRDYGEFAEYFVKDNRSILAPLGVNKQMRSECMPFIGCLAFDLWDINIISGILRSLASAVRERISRVIFHDRRMQLFAHRMFQKNLPGLRILEIAVDKSWFPGNYTNDPEDEYAIYSIRWRYDYSLIKKRKPPFEIFIRVGRDHETDWITPLGTYAPDYVLKSKSKHKNERRAQFEWERRERERLERFSKEGRQATGAVEDTNTST